MPTKNKKKFEGFSEAERDAMKARAKELVAEGRSSKKREQGVSAALEAIAEMSEPDRSLAKKIHELITKTAPDLLPKTWYGMPAYANADNKVVCFFQAAKKFESRYATLGFNDSSNLDEGNMWPTTFGIKKLSPTEEAKIVALVKKAVS
jgi:uncharacterized protein YdhG (YjbR/CyaY superfamily)